MGAGYRNGIRHEPALGHNMAARHHALSLLSLLLVLALSWLLASIPKAAASSRARSQKQRDTVAYYSFWP
eukprot:8606712-Pyramimonas_sp.AAC.1